MPPRRPAVVIVTHTRTARGGAIAAALARLGCDAQLVCPRRGDVLPALDGGRPRGIAGAVVLGGDTSVGDLPRARYLRDEHAWIREQIAVDAPLLGVCLGAQLMADALGARVAPRGDGLCEIGYVTVRATAAGRAVLPEALLVYQWHDDAIELPAGCELLASGETFAVQAFRHGSRVYGLQFHAEMTPSILERWLAGAQAEAALARPGAQPVHAQRAVAAASANAVQCWLGDFLAGWLELV